MGCAPELAKVRRVCYNLKTTKYRHTECRPYRIPRYGWWKGNEVRILNDNCRCMCPKFLCRRRKSVIGKLRRQSTKMRGSDTPYGASHKTCFDTVLYVHLHRSGLFARACLSARVFICVRDLWHIAEKLSCGNFQNGNYRGFFIVAVKERK